MKRAVGCLGLAILITGCRSYDRYGRVVHPDGLVPADVFARYGTEQAEAIAIGRALGTGHTGMDEAALAQQVTQAVTYAKGLPDVTDVRADTAAFLLTVTFKSGWKKGITPIDDGTAADQTPGLPSRR
jgi:hypothetical protein